MKGNLNTEQTLKEARTFTILACVFSGISLVMFWFIGIAGIAAGARALVLSSNKDMDNIPAFKTYKIFSITAIIAGIVSVLYGLS